VVIYTDASRRVDCPHGALGGNPSAQRPRDRPLSGKAAATAAAAAYHGSRRPKQRTRSSEGTVLWVGRFGVLGLVGWFAVGARAKKCKQY
jgi:hypothetical protein